MIRNGDFLARFLHKVMALCAAGGMALCNPPAPAQSATAQNAPEQAAPPDASASAETASPEPPKPKGLTRPLKPKGNPGSWPLIKTLPSGAPFPDGIVGFTLQVGDDGRPQQCEVTSSSGNAELDSFTCSLLMKRARFDPKLVDGVPVPATYSSRVRWELPEGALPPAMAGPEPRAATKPAPPLAPQMPIGPSRPLKPKGNPSLWVPFSDYPAGPLREGIEGTAGFILYVGADGRPTRCTVTQSSGNAELDAATCSGLMKRAIFEPKMVDGEVVPSTYSNRVRWVIPTETPQPESPNP